MINQYSKHNKYLGNSVYSDGFRTYSTNSSHHHRLLTWTQRRCVKCQRFLSKLQKKYCKDCTKIADKESQRKYESTRPKRLVYIRNYRREHADVRKLGNLRGFVRNHADELQVGAII